jgi:hypothetical protein
MILISSLKKPLNETLTQTLNGILGVKEFDLMSVFIVKK